MNICQPATILLVISILGIIFDSYLFGFNIFEFIKNILFTIIIVFIANWSCYKVGYGWISWLIVIISLLALFSLIYFIKNKNSENVKYIIEEEEKNRNK
jgi:hypothetical protein